MAQQNQKLTALSTVRSAPKISIKGRWRPQKQSFTGPGPGAYTPQPPKGGTCATIQGKYSKAPGISTPGPGHYTQESTVLKGAPQYGFGTQSRLKSTRYSRTPGPGAYTLSLPQGPSMGIHSRWKTAEIDKSALGPGPGTYVPATANAVVFEKAPKFGFGTSTRPQAANTGKDMPGPGEYGLSNALSKSANGPMYSIKGRTMERNKASETPGPGAFGGITSF